VEIYWDGLTYVRWTSSAAPEEIPYGMCFFDYYTATFTRENPLSAPWFDAELWLGPDTELLGWRYTPGRKSTTLRLRTCVLGARLARNPQLGIGKYTMSVHSAHGARVKSLKHAVNAYIYLTEDEWSAGEPRFGERIADKITFVKKKKKGNGGGGGVIIVASPAGSASGRAR
jgi:hypothetical protein